MGYMLSKPLPPDHPMMETGWCEINWGQNSEMKESLWKLRISAVDHLRILVVGPVRAGKSSFIHSIDSILQNKMINTTCTVATGAGSSTETYTTNRFRDEHRRYLPFVISDVMGLENGRDPGVQPEDIINALKGHIKEGYEFKTGEPCSEKDPGYNSCPTLSDRVHCLVLVIPINTFTANSNYTDETTNVHMDHDLLKRMQSIRHGACDLGIPHVVILTKVDLACPHVKQDIKLVYRSKEIHQKVQACHALGVPMSFIFPVKNYHQENQLNPDMDAVLLFTLTQILNYANDFVEKEIKRSFSSAPLPDPLPPLKKTSWCEINWGQNSEKKKNLRKLEIRNPAVDHLRILVAGPVGSGKSSFIQSLNSIFKNRMINTACTVATGGHSFTKAYTTNTFKDEGKNLLFIISDVMGLETKSNSGVQPEDIINAFKGHIKEGYTFDSVKPCSEKDPGYNSCPTLSDRVHCLVFVIPVDTFIANSNYTNNKTDTHMDNDLLTKMQGIRQGACDLGIPQVVLLTKVDLACRHVQKDIKHVYMSKAIYQKAQACSYVLGVPMSCIFPVKNYHEEKELNPDVDAVLLFTLTQILNYANDFVEKMNDLEGCRDHSEGTETFHSLM